jgi:hypothetical protein
MGLLSVVFNILDDQFEKGPGNSEHHARVHSSFHPVPSRMLWNFHCGTILDGRACGRNQGHVQMIDNFGYFCDTTVHMPSWVLQVEN